MGKRHRRKKKVHKLFLAIKYATDFVVAVIALICTSPIFVIVALAIKIEDGGKIIFAQPRRGRYGKIFKCYKFRSMKSTHIPFTPEHTVIKDNNVNLTKVGKVIRKLRIDELPQLFNIIKGDMCIIGHRPLMVHYYVYEEWELIKFEMRPGLTGLGQVHGNSYLVNRIRRYYDIYYITHLSLHQDIAIFFKTIAVIFFGERRFLKRVSWEEYNKLKNNIINNYRINPKTIQNFEKSEVVPSTIVAEEEAAFSEYRGSKKHKDKK